MASWQNFYFLCGSSASGLTGLMFVAVTFGSKIVTKENLDQVHTFLSSICFHFIHVFLLCCIGSIPGDEPNVMAFAAALSGAWRLKDVPHVYRTIRKSAEANHEIEQSDWLLSLVLPSITYVGFIAAGIGFYILSPLASHILAASLIALLMIGMRGAWDMLIWIATKVN